MDLLFRLDHQLIAWRPIEVTDFDITTDSKFLHKRNTFPRIEYTPKQTATDIIYRLHLFIREQPHRTFHLGCFALVCEVL